MIRSLTLITLLSAFMALSGCKTAGGQAFVACELNHLPQTEESVIADVASIITAGSIGWQQQLLQLGVSVGPSQLACIEQAILAAWTASKGEPTPERIMAIRRLQTALATHPAKACAPLKSRYIALPLQVLSSNDEMFDPCLSSPTIGCDQNAMLICDDDRGWRCVHTNLTTNRE
jgi:hypothetical protein